VNAHEKDFNAYTVGEVIPAPSRTVTEADVVNFAGVSGDYHPLHLDETHARASEFGERIAHGMLTMSIMSGLMFSAGISSPYSMGFLGLNDWKFAAPVYLGDTVTVRIEVANKRETRRGDRGVVTFRLQIINRTRDDEVACEGDWVQMYRKIE